MSLEQCVSMGPQARHSPFRASVFPFVRWGCREGCRRKPVPLVYPSCCVAAESMLSRFQVGEVGFELEVKGRTVHVYRGGGAKIKLLPLTQKEEVFPSLSLNFFFRIMGILDALTSQTKRPAKPPWGWRPGLCSLPSPRPRGAAAAPAEPRLSGSRPARASAAEALAEVGTPAAADLARIMQTPLAIPVPVLRLPRGPDGLSRGFAPDGRRALLKLEVPEIPESPVDQESRESQEQRARAVLRERYLRSLLAMVGRQVSFTLHEGVHVTAYFGATDLDVANFYVSQLQTPIGVQAEALLRCSDIIAYTFKP
ncbi:gem-associated protein 7 isoform X2 [Camelus bactrianus]|uniref:Gem-associated protein 7 isoform X2 n=1 Tax=Camelus bactrianus TaxID=9837 RepID=A0AC58QTD5_CAMBA